MTIVRLLALFGVLGCLYGVPAAFAQTEASESESLTPAAEAALENLGVTGAKAGFDNQANATTVIGATINVIISLTGLAFLIIILYAGFLYITDTGDATKVAKAKKLFGSAIIGIVLVLSAYAITTFVLDRVQEAVQPEEQSSA